MSHDAAHERDELEGATDDPATFPLAYSGVVGSLVLVVTIILVTAFYYRQEGAFQGAAEVTTPAIEARQLRDAQQLELNSYRYLDEKRQTVGIPIEQAMKLVIRDQGVLPKAPASAPAKP